MDLEKGEAIHSLQAHLGVTSLLKVISTYVLLKITSKLHIIGVVIID